jgi:sulfonate dioxygenase
MIHIQELKEQEGVHMLAFLREHMHSADDLTVRWRWTPGAVAIWDNRSVAHRAVAGGYDKSLREGKRTAIFGERPFYDPMGQTWSERFNSEEFQDNEGFDYVKKGATVQ